MTVALAAVGLRRWARRPSVAPRELALLTALVAPSVAGGALVAERSASNCSASSFRCCRSPSPISISPGFAAALVAALLCAEHTRRRRCPRLAALCVPAGVLVVLIGFFAGTAVELAGTVVLTAGMWLVAWLTWSQRRGAERVGAGAVRPSPRRPGREHGPGHAVGPGPGGRTAPPLGRLDGRHAWGGERRGLRTLSVLRGSGRGIGADGRPDLRARSARPGTDRSHRVPPSAPPACTSDASTSRTRPRRC